MSKEKYWLEHLEAQRTSGLSQAEYCRQKKLKENQFCYWQGKLKRVNGSNEGKFTEVGCSREERLEVVLSNGARIKVPERFEESSLRRLLEVVGC